MSDPSAIAHAVSLLQRGDLVAFPTETVYGLGADASNPLAIRRIFAAKGRPSAHPLIIHLGNTRSLADWAQPNALAAQPADAFWPGPLTLILPRSSRVPDEVTGGLETVGIRVPDHPVAQALLTGLGSGIAAPSANRFGRISPTTAAHVQGEFGEEVFVLDGGPTQVGVESTIIDLSGSVPALLRPGGIPIEDIETIVGPLGTSQTRAPGTLESHYQPSTALRLSAHPEQTAEALRAQGKRVAILESAEPAEYARYLYAELRRLDAEGVDVLVAKPAEGGGLAPAVNDRLRRAAFSTELGPEGQEKD